jgi:hypothetical protein
MASNTYNAPSTAVAGNGHVGGKRVDSGAYSSIYSDNEKLGTAKTPLIDNKNPYGN